MYLANVLSGYQSGSNLAQGTMDSWKKAKEQKKIDGVKKAYQGMMTNPTFYDEKTAQPTPKGITFLYQHYDADAVKKVLGNTNNPYSSGFAKQPQIDAKTGKPIESTKPVKLKPITDAVAKRMAYTLHKNKTIPLQTMFNGYETDSTLESLMASNNRAGIINYLVGDTFEQAQNKEKRDKAHQSSQDTREWTTTISGKYSKSIADLHESKIILVNLLSMINDENVSTNPQIQADIILKLARLMTGVGVLTESDIARSLPTGNVWQQIKLQASQLSDKHLLSANQLDNLAMMIQKLLNNYNQKYNSIYKSVDIYVKSINKKHGTDIEVNHILPSNLDLSDEKVTYKNKDWGSSSKKSQSQEKQQKVELSDEDKKALQDSGI